jgi:gliding motility-associated-like protein
MQTKQFHPQHYAGIACIIDALFSNHFKRRIMRSSIFFILISSFLLLPISGEAQKIVRSVLCSTGATLTGSKGILTSTFGQCPGCGTLQSQAGILTQGFQQPAPKDSCFTASFSHQAVAGNCGTVLNFTYTGNAQTAQATFEWDFGADAFPKTSTQANPQGIAFSSTGLKTIQLKVTVPGCQRITTLDIQIDQTGFSSNPTIQHVKCKGASDGGVSLQFNGGTAPFNVKWSNGETSQGLSDLKAGDYSYTVTDAIGCTTTNTVTVKDPVNFAVISFTKDNETCNGDKDGSIEATITGGIPPYEYEWSDGSSGADIQNLSKGKYVLTVTDDEGCTTTGEVNIGLDCKPDLPGILTPNGDGQNDFFVIDGIEQFPNNEVKMYNRWGEIVWSKKAYMNDWAGTNNKGEPLPLGAFYYVVYLNDPDKTVISGSLTIVR